MDDFDFISALNSFNEKYLPKILIFLLVFVVGSLIEKLNCLQQIQAEK